MYTAKCKDCHVDYRCNPPLTNRDDWVTHVIYYRINDNQYNTVVMNLQEKKTIIWVYYQPSNGIDMYSIKFPGIFPETRPEDILSLTKRLHKLTAFL